MGVRLSSGATAKVLDVTDTHIKLDANHRLAGKTLNFDLELVGVTPASEVPKVEAETVTAGDGVTFPEPGKTLRMHYCGFLKESGKKFDSSRDRGDPFTFTIGV